MGLTTSQKSTLGVLLALDGWRCHDDIRSAGGHAASLPKLIELGRVEKTTFNERTYWRAVRCSSGTSARNGPISETRLLELADEAMGLDSSEESLIMFARAVEAAHGIT